jgi:methionyl aminopeptidase
MFKMWDHRTRVKTEAEIAKMRESSRIVYGAIHEAGSLIKPGVTTLELDAAAEKYILEHGGSPAFKGYRVGRQVFKYAACISVNDAVVHGIPNEKPLQEGDIVTIDVGVEKDGWFGDSAWTFPVGAISPEKQQLLDVTRESLMLGIAQAKAGNKLYDISKAISSYCESFGYGVVRDLVGHGIGEHLHEEPQVPNYLPKKFDKEYRNITLVEGMTLAIEPMINMGTWKVNSLSDGWTVVTADAKPSAHFEHTIVIRPDGGEILTKS